MKDIDIFDKFAQYDIERLLNPKDKGYESAQTGGAIGGGVGGSVLAKPLLYSEPVKNALKDKVLLRNLRNMGALGLIIAGVYGGRTLADALRPEKSKLELWREQLSDGA